MKPLSARLSPLFLVVFSAVAGGCAGAGPVPWNQTQSQGGDPASGRLRVTTLQMPAGLSHSPYWASLSAEGGQPPYHWSLAAGQLPAGLALDSSQGVIAGTAADAGNFAFTLRVEDASPRENTARTDLSIDVLPPGKIAAAGQGCAASGCYGPGIGADGLANTTVGPHGNQVSYRFKSRKSGQLQRVRLYLIPDHPGYAAGTGGKLKIDIVTDDGTPAHNPANTILASYVLNSPLAASPSRYFPLIQFAAPPSLAEGRIYHIVFSNVDASPSVNYLSVDALYVRVLTTPVQPSFSDVDNAVLLRQGSGKWQPRAGYTPIMELTYSDGFSAGTGYIEGWVGAQELVSGNKAVRETFTLSGAPRKVGIIGIRAARVGGNDDLKVRLENADGSLIEQGAIDAQAFPLSSSPEHRWGTYVFSSPQNLMPGRTYHLVLETPAASMYKVFPIRKGGDYGFAESTFYHDGSAEMKEGADWTGWTQWGVSDRHDGDLQFYFGLAH